MGIDGRFTERLDWNLQVKFVLSLLQKALDMVRVPQHTKVTIYGKKFPQPFEPKSR
jgi:hypothetical protein